MNIESSSRLADLVTQDSRYATVLSLYGLDFSCHGDLSLQQACAEKSVNFETVMAALKALPEQLLARPPFNRFAEWPLGFFVDYINTNHHLYLHKMVPVIQAGLEKLARVHGTKHPHLLDCSTLYNEVAENIQQHLWKEENILFPYIQTLENPRPTAGGSMRLDSAECPINVMRMEHEREVTDLFRLRELTNSYTAPADGCATYCTTYQQLAEFDLDLMQHIHIENNILFPAVLETEQKNR